MAGEEQSPFVTVASTLLVAALFSPLRRNIQHNIDKRFFRRKYDVTQTLEAFNATIREGADLEELSEALLGVVNETMQPEHVSMWLKDQPGGQMNNVVLVKGLLEQK
jgi:K+-sensing histidine kinase KdpD